MSLPNFVAITRNAQDADVDTGQAFPVEIAWLTGDGPIRSAKVAPSENCLGLPLAVEEHGITWDTLKKEGKPLKDVLEMVDRDLSGKVVYCYRQDFRLWLRRKCPFELRWFDTPNGAPEGTFLICPSIMSRSATRWADNTTAELPPGLGSTQIVYALNYYSVMIGDVCGELLPLLLDAWTQPRKNSMTTLRADASNLAAKRVIPA